MEHNNNKYIQRLISDRRRLLQEKAKLTLENKELKKQLTTSSVVHTLPSKEEVSKFTSKSVNELYGEEEHALKRNYINGIKDLYRFIDNKLKGLD